MIDILDCNGYFTGHRASRDEVHLKGYYHRAIHVYMFDPSANIIVQKRSQHVAQFPNCLSISVTGHVDAGEDSTTSAVREIQEELGLSKSDYSLQYFFSAKHEVVVSKYCVDKQFNDVFIANCPTALSNISLNPLEVELVKLMSFEDFVKLVENKDPSIPAHYGPEVASLSYLLKQKGGLGLILDSLVK